MDIDALWNVLWNEGITLWKWRTELGGGAYEENWIFIPWLFVILAGLSVIGSLFKGSKGGED